MTFAPATKSFLQTFLLRLEKQVRKRSTLQIVQDWCSASAGRENPVQYQRQNRNCVDYLPYQRFCINLC